MSGNLERSVLHAVLEEFGCGKNFRIWRNNTGAAYQGKRLIDFGLEGSPDVIGILGSTDACPHCGGLIPNGGHWLGLETKRERGGRRGQQQLIFHANAAKYGARVAFVDSLEEAREYMRSWGAVW